MKALHQPVLGKTLQVPADCKPENLQLKGHFFYGNSAVCRQFLPQNLPPP